VENILLKLVGDRDTNPKELGNPVTRAERAKEGKDIQRKEETGGGLFFMLKKVGPQKKIIAGLARGTVRKK